MNHIQPTTALELLKQNERKDLLRLLTAGSVDDGKSTLIGRLLYDSKTLYEDHLSALERDSRRRGSAGEDIDYSLLLDGLKAEREQGITIDVAYRYFSTPRRKFIIADTPGHEQYTRNMATGGSTADLAIILIDARQGVLAQTRRHTFIASLLGIKHILVAINKMDLVDYSQEIYDEIQASYTDFTTKLAVHDIKFIPISALKGDNVVSLSERTPWYQGGSLLNYLETVHVASDRNMIDMRFPVQYVLRPDLNFRGYCGTVASGIMRPGDEVMVLPSGQRSRVSAIYESGEKVDEAFSPMAVVATLEDEIDISRGNMLVHVNNVPHIGRRFDAMLVWMNEAGMKLNAAYMIKHSTSMVPAQVTALRYRINVNTLHREEADQLMLNEIGRAELTLHQPLAFDPYSLNKQTGSFIVIDRLTNATVAAGMILERTPGDLVSELNRDQNPASSDIHSHASQVEASARAERLNQQPATVWLTGLPKAGKSTIAFALEKRLFDMGCFPHVVDGENMRLGISKDLGFTGTERSENIRRSAELARLCNDIGLITIAAFVTPYEEDRQYARKVIGQERYLEVYVNAPLEVCETRDPDKLYERARSGEIENFSGVTAPFEKPASCDLELHTDQLSVAAAVDAIVAAMRSRGFIPEA